MKNVLFVVLVTLSGCCTNLQKSYVDAMEDTYEAIILDVEKGLYQPDDLSKTTLDSWKQANTDARAALEAEGK